jgi:sugar phosphate isomerase/epimerase
MTHNGGKLDETIKQVAPQAILVSLNGIDVARKQYQGRLDQGDFDLVAYVKKVRAAGYKGPFGLQGYNVPGEPAENLRLSMES